MRAYGAAIRSVVLTVVVLPVAGLLTTSCAGRTHIAPDPQTTVTAIATADFGSPFDQPRISIAATEQRVKTSSRYELLRFEFPSNGGNGQPDDMVVVDYHRSTLPGSHPVIIVLPIWGRYVYPSNAVTRTIRQRSNGSVHVLNVLGETFLTDWAALGFETDKDEFIAILAAGADHEQNTVFDFRRLVDWAENRHEIDTSGIGLIGFSHSAIVAPVIAAVDPRIDATVLVMGGAHPHRIIARCTGPRMTAVQEHGSVAFGWNR